MKLFEQVRGTIEKVDSKGHGIIEKNGKNIAVHFTVPRDEVEITLTKRKKGALQGRLDKVLSPSPDRIKPRCEYVGKCGGCPWQIMTYEKQIELKRNLVNEAFREAHLPFSINEVIASKEIFFHRNRMDYVFGQNGELGLKEPEKWWSVLDLNVCYLLSEGAVRVMKITRDWALKHELPCWDLKKHAGLLRYLVIREGKFTGERLVTLVTSNDKFSEEARNDLVKQLKGNVTSLYWGINPKETDLSLAEELHLLDGKRNLSEKINGLTFDIHPNSFFQTNSLMAGKLMDGVREFAAPNGNERLLDLYCGAGFFGIGCAKSAKEVVGIELDEQAIELARENAQANHITNATFMAGSAEKTIHKIQKPDVVIIDPPRGGLHPNVIKVLMSMLPKRIVYVSCNYESLIRELPTFLKQYEIKQIKAIDMFPHGPHVEVVTQFELK